MRMFLSTSSPETDEEALLWEETAYQSRQNSCRLTKSDLDLLLSCGDGCKE